MVQNLKSSKNVLPKSQNITLNKLKEILNDINFSKDEIFDYISKLSAKIALYQYNLNNLHGKEKSLNDKKHNYFDRVKKIMSENYLNFEELTKNNSRFESFLYNNEIFINEMKLKNREKNLNEINKRLNTKLESNETSMSNMSKLTKEEKEKYEQELKLRLNKEQLLNNANEFSLMEFAGGINAVPAQRRDEFRYVADNLRTLACGTALCTFKGRDEIPAHALAVSKALNKNAVECYDADFVTAIQYLKREAITINGASKGYVLICYKGLPLGWVKNLGTRCNNLYPEYWRIRK